jgi:hypothetical protein
MIGDGISCPIACENADVPDDRECDAPPLYCTVKIETLRLNLSDVKISFLNRKGEPFKPGDESRACNFTIEGPGIDTKRVRCVRIPDLNYLSSKPLVVEVDMEVGSSPLVVDVIDLL